MKVRALPKVVRVSLAKMKDRFEVGMKCEFKVLVSDLLFDY